MTPDQTFAKTYWYTCDGLNGRMGANAFGGYRSEEAAKRCIREDLRQRRINSRGLRVWPFRLEKDVVDMTLLGPQGGHTA